MPSASFPITGLSTADADALLDSTIYFSGTSNWNTILSGLTIGKNYEVQLILVDHRGSTGVFYIGDNNGAGGISPSFLPGWITPAYGPSVAPQIVTGTFTATASTHSFNLAEGPTNNNGFIMAYQLRDVTSTQESRPMYWTGAVSTAWNIADTNFKLTSNDADTQFHTNDAVFFHDNPVTSTVDISAGNVSPISVTFDNSIATSYTLQGSNGIASGSFTKSGTGSVTITNTNSNSGAVALNGGLTAISNIGGLGSGAMTFDGGELKYTGATGAWTRSYTLNSGGGSIHIDAANTTLSTSGAFSGFTSPYMSASNPQYAAALASNPNLVVIQLGTNDTIGTTAQIETYFTDNLTDLVNVFKATVNHPEIWLALPPKIYGSPYGNSETRLVIAPTATFTNNPTITVTNTTTIKQVVNGTGFAKAGSGTLILTGINTYSGPTIINDGTLRADGSLHASSSVTVASNGTLTGSGFVNGPVSAAGTLAPGSTGTGTLHTGPVTLSGTYACQVDGANCDLLAANGSLTLTGATLAISTIAAPTATSYVIATYTGALPAFTTVTGMPSGYIMDASTAGQIKLVSSPAYATWASTQSLSAANSGKTLDPDHDGFTNLQEFLFGKEPMVNDGSLTNTGTTSTHFVIHWRERATAATYRLMESATLANPWTESTVAIESDGLQTGDYLPKKALVPIGADKKFFRIEGVEN